MWFVPIPWELINKQEVAADMALAMVGPFTFQRMIKPFGSEWFVVGDEKQHGFFDALHVVTPGMGEPSPIFGESSGVVRSAW